MRGHLNMFSHLCPWRSSLLLAFMSISLFLIESAAALTAVQPDNCSQCHVCDSPTGGDPCLRTCPRPHVNGKQPTDTPSEISINELEYEYEGVYFAHKLHAGMTEMNKGCQNCHHYQEAGGITACKHCHPANVADEKLEQPGLKGAYHRQCLGCHQEWSGETSCEVCHLKKDVPQARTEDHLPPLMNSRFAPIYEPEKKVWSSSYGGGTVVTLHHRAHTEEYGIDCAACHHAEGCGSCHGQKEKTTAVRHSEEALHAICNACHAEMSCDQCHLKSEAAEFSHERTGWPLGKQHSQLACKRCHGNPTHFTKPPNKCNSCHSRWATANFDHTRAGFVLSENHKEFDCTSCHVARDFAAKPTCAECHDADIHFPEALPGEYRR